MKCFPLYVLIGDWYCWTLRPYADVMLYGVWTSGKFGVREQ